MLYLLPHSSQRHYNMNIEDALTRLFSQSFDMSERFFGSSQQSTFPFSYSSFILLLFIIPADTRASVTGTNYSTSTHYSPCVEGGFNHLGAVVEKLR